MSTSSTATATLPAHHSHYGYSHHQSYQANAANHSTSDPNHSVAPRIAVTYNAYSNLNHPSPSARNSTASSKQPAPASMAASQPTPIPSQINRERRPDWHEFYKNGPPKEIIVIDDDSPVPVTRSTNEASSYVKQNTLGNGASVEHASKKRKINYNTGSLQHQASYSTTNTPHHGGSGSSTISTDRTTSLQTTAPTSLGSHGSGGSSSTFVEPSVAGQKRKRVTRQTTADEKKRREIEVNGDAYSFYVPPPNPPIKAKEVFVQPVKDVPSPLPE